MTGFSYHEIDEIEPDSDYNIQMKPGHNQSGSNLPVKPLLSPTPLGLGILQVLVGLITAALGAVEVFVVPILVNTENNISLAYYNCYGAAIFSGFLLVLAGSCAIRAHIKRDRTEAWRFYGVTLFAFLGVLALVILTQVCYTKLWTHMETEMTPYYITSLLGSISSILGLLLLMVAVSRYFWNMMVGDGKMVEMFIICCFPCCAERKSDENVA